jgi:hypothetical protein
MRQIVFALAVALSVAACSKEQPKKVATRPVRVTSVQHALSGDTISLTGQVQAKDPINLAFRIGGRLRERNVTVATPLRRAKPSLKLNPKISKIRCVRRKPISLQRKLCCRMRKGQKVGRTSC